MARLHDDDAHYDPLWDASDDDERPQHGGGSSDAGDTTKRNVQYVLRVLQVEYCKVHVCSSASDCCRRRRSCARSAGGSHTCEVTGVALAYAYACLLWRLPRAHCWQWIETFRPVTGATSQMTLVGIPLIVLCGGCLLRAVGSVSRCCVQ